MLQCIPVHSGLVTRLPVQKGSAASQYVTGTVSGMVSSFQGYERIHPSSKWLSTAFSGHRIQ